MKTLITIALLVASALTATGFAQDATKLGQKAEATPASASDAAAIAAQVPSYPMTVCVISGEPLDAGASEDVLHEGRLVRFCCGMCKKSFAKSPEKYIAEIDKAVVVAQKDSYPFDKCIISDEALGSMGDPIEYVHETRLVRMCCKGCVKSFQKKSADYMDRIDAAMIEQQLASYPLDVCPFSNNKLDDKAVNTLYGTRLVRTCCGDCAVELQTHPEKALAMLDAAAATKKPVRAGAKK